MKIRRAGMSDCERVLELLSQVLEIHAKIRPDIFVSGTTKYTGEDLQKIFSDDATPVYVALDDSERVVGYAFCRIRDGAGRNNMKDFKSVFIDDLCVDEEYRGRRIGEALFEYVKNEAAKLGCYEIMLTVWEGNEGAMRFYEKMGLRPKETLLEYIL